MSTQANKIAAIYARRSIKKDNNSIESQISLAKDKILDKGLELYEIYRDEISATETHFRNRPAFNKLLNDAKQGKFDTLVVFRRDRLARNVDEFKEMQFLFRKYGIQILYSNPGEYESDEKSFSSGFIENLIVAMDELEAKVIKERTRSGKEKKRERGEYISGLKTPTGYIRIEASPGKPNTKDSTGSTSKYVKNEHEAKVIQCIFEKYVKLYSYKTAGTLYSEEDFISDITEACNNDENLLKTMKLASPTPPHLSDFEYYIKRPIYCGYMYKNPNAKLKDIILEGSNGEFIIDESKIKPCANVEPTVSLDHWKEAVIAWRENKFTEKSARKPYLFKDLLYCSCNIKLNIQRNKSYPDKDCFICKKCKAKFPFSTLINVILEKLISDLSTNIKSSLEEQQITTIIKNKIEEKIDSQHQQLNGLIGELAKIHQEQKNKIKELAKVKANSKTLINQFDNLIKKEEDVIKSKVAIENNIYRYQTSLDAVDILDIAHIQSVGKSFFTSDPINGQKILDQLINKVVVFPENHMSCSIDYGIEQKSDEEKDEKKKILGENRKEDARE